MTEVTVVIEGGCCVDVRGLPEGYDWVVEDYDNLDELHPDDIIDAAIGTFHQMPPINEAK